MEDNQKTDIIEKMLGDKKEHLRELFSLYAKTRDKKYMDEIEDITFPILDHLIMEDLSRPDYLSNFISIDDIRK